MKSAVERKFDTWNDRYRKRFGEYYGIMFGDPRSFEEHIAIMKKCIEDGTPYEYKTCECVLHMDDVVI